MKGKQLVFFFIHKTVIYSTHNNLKIKKKDVVAFRKCKISFQENWSLLVSQIQLISFVLDTQVYSSSIRLDYFCLQNHYNSSWHGFKCFERFFQNLDPLLLIQHSTILLVWLHMQDLNLRFYCIPKVFCWIEIQLFWRAL